MSKASIEALESRAYFSVDLSASISVAAPGSHQVKPGQGYTVSIEVFNNGTTTASGSLTTDLDLSSSPSGSSPISEGTSRNTIHLAAGAHTTIKVTKKIAAGFTPGTYYALADVDPGNSFSETNLANNTAVSSNTLTVLSLYPNLIGMWSGQGKVTKGADKGLIYSHTTVFTSENDATGAFTITGSNTFPNGDTTHFTGQGTVSAKGAIKFTSNDVPSDPSGTLRGTGKVVGSKLTINYTNALASGMDTLRREV